jgi:hypothetical protein
VFVIEFPSEFELSVECEMVFKEESEYTMVSEVESLE